MTIRLMVLISTQPGRRQDQVTAFERLVPLVRAETGCLRYDLHAVEGDDDRLVILEEWATQADLDAHGVAPHMVEAAEANADFRAGPAEAIFLSPEPLV